MNSSHVPVLLHEAIHALHPTPGQFVIDGTVGGGGHAHELIARIAPGGTFLGVDWNERSLTAATPALRTAGAAVRVITVHDSFAHLPDILAARNLPLADRLLLDLGFSSDELTGYGLSFMRDEPLDMRYGDQRRAPSAADLVARLSAPALAELIVAYGEERNAERIARAIVRARAGRPIRTTAALADIIARAVPSRGRMHPATKTFQALRIAVNRELDELGTLLGALDRVVRPGGRIAVITFHSLEDRIVKHRFAELAAHGGATLLFKKPIVPGRDEVHRNPRSRSAKLRAIEL